MNAISAMADRHMRGEQKHDERLWALVNLEIWQRIFLDGEPVESISLARLSARRHDMHILWLKTELLHPVDKGGKIRTYQTLRHLKAAHRVTYLTLDDGSAAPDAERAPTSIATT